jgi:hypothetical protein
MGGVRPNASENGQIAGSDAIRDGRNARRTAQAACGFRGTPPSATVYAVPGFIRGMSVNRNFFSKNREFSRQNREFDLGPIF